MADIDKTLEEVARQIVADLQRKRLKKAGITLLIMVVIAILASFLNAHLLNYVYSKSLMLWFGLPALGAGKVYVMTNLAQWAMGTHYLVAKSTDDKNPDPLAVAQEALQKLIGMSIIFPLLITSILSIVIFFSGK